MNVGEPVVGWVEVHSLRRSARIATVNAVIQVTAMGALSAASFALSVPFMGWVALGLAAFAGVVNGWLASLQWRAIKDDWGVLHARREGDTLTLGNPFNLAFGKRVRFARDETVTLAVIDRKVMRRPGSLWTIAGRKVSVRFPAPGARTEERWHELVTALQRLGFTVVTQPWVAGVAHDAPRGPDGSQKGAAKIIVTADG